MSKRPKKAKSLFLEVLKQRDTKGFLNFLAQHKCKKSSFTYELLLKSLSELELLDAWQCIFDLVQTLAPVLLEIEDSPTSDYQVSLRCATDVLQSAVILANLTLRELSSYPLGLLQTVVFLHGILLRFSDNHDYLKNCISQLCEKFWINDISGKEEVILNAALYILKRTLRVKGTKTDVKRAYMIRTGIQSLMSSEIEDKEEFLDILKQCVSSTLYLSSHEGSKFIEFLLCLDVSLVETFHDAIKLHMPSCSLKQSETYGVIYYNAWMRSIKENLSELKEKLELSCIQDFMYHAVHVQRNRPRSLVPLLRKFLAAFHKKKKDFRVLRMLRDLYEPILWRALKDASVNVRANASQLFFDVFPLEDPDFNIAETETELQRQLIIIKDLMLDEYPLIRSISAIGVCLVMGCHWELLPIEMVTTYFKILTEELACDSSSADVRCAVIKGVRALISENQLVVPTLKCFLPKLQSLFHDISEKVRISFCHLLLSVKKIRFIKYWDIVPIEHLLARLDEDKPAVARLIVQLVCNSYLPSNKPEEFWLARCIDIIKIDHSASKVFFMHVPEFIDIKVIVKFMILACRTLNVYVQSKDKKKIRNMGFPVEDKENQTFGFGSLDTSFKSDGPLGFDDPKIITGLLDALTILFIGIQNQLEKPENKTLYKELIARFGMHMPTLLKHFKDSEIRMNVLMLCGLLPPSFIPALSNICMTKLKNVASDGQLDEYAVLLVCLCNHDKSNDVLYLIKNWILYGLNKDEPQPKKQKTGRDKKLLKTDVPPKPLLGVKFLESLLDQPMCRTSVLKNNIHTLKEIIDYMKIIQNVIKSVKKSLDDEEEESFLFRTFSSIAKLAVLLQGEKAMDSDEFIRSLLSWTSDVFFAMKDGKQKQLRRSLRSLDEGTEKWNNLGFKISKDLLMIATDMVLMGFIKENTTDYIRFAKNVIQSGYGPVLLKLVVSFISQVAENGKFLVDDAELRNNNQSLVVDAFDVIMTVLVDEEFVLKIAQSDQGEIRSKLKDLLTLQSKHKFDSDCDVKTFITSLFNSIHHKTVPSIQNLPSGSSASFSFSSATMMLLSLITGSEELMKLFITVVNESTKAMDLNHSFVSCFIVNHAIEGSKNMHKKLQSEIKHAVEMFGKKFSDISSGTPSEDEKCLLAEAEQQLNNLKQALQSCTHPSQA